MTERSYESHRIEWCGRTIEVRYCPDWMPGFERTYGHKLAHLEIETIESDRAPLPVTQTGYRSHFTDAEEVAEAGGPVPYTAALLDAAAEDPAWQEREAAARQISLF